MFIIIASHGCVFSLKFLYTVTLAALAGRALHRIIEQCGCDRGLVCGRPGSSNITSSYMYWWQSLNSMHSGLPQTIYMD